MKKSEVVTQLHHEIGALYGITKGQLQHILRELDLLYVRGLAQDGEVTLGSLGRIVVKKLPARTLKSTLIEGGSRELPDRDKLAFEPTVRVRKAVSEGDYDAITTFILSGKKRS